jgi:hypothetical protein
MTAYDARDLIREAERTARDFLAHPDFPWRCGSISCTSQAITEKLKRVVERAPAKESFRAMEILHAMAKGEFQ